MSKKYELLDKDPETGLHRIKALRDIPKYGIRAGDLGGFIGSEENLSHTGDAWVFGNANVSGNAKVSENAKVSGNARVFGYAKVFGNALVSGDAGVWGNAWVSGNAHVYGKAWVQENAGVYGNAKVLRKARLSGYAEVSGDAWVLGDAKIKRNIRIESNLDFISFYGPRHHITITKGYISIGCKIWDSLDDFFQDYVDVAEYYDYTKEEREFTRDMVEAGHKSISIRSRKKV